MKVLGTNTSVGFDRLNALKELGYIGHHNQFRIICKCKSMADANRKCEAAGVGSKTFQSTYTSETGNKTELEICEKTDIAFGIDQTGKTYVTIEQLDEQVKKMLEKK